jgi:hypothetical protein
MDLSKLPKLSNTGATQPPPTAATPMQAEPPLANVVEVRYVPASSSIGFAEAWISIAIGLLLLFIFPNTIHFVFSPASFNQNNPVTDGQGNTISYVQSGFFWTDLGATVFAAALILEGIALAALRKPALLWIALGVTVAAGLFNVGVIIHVQALTGFPIICGAGVAVLGYMAFTQWRLIAALKK